MSELKFHEEDYVQPDREQIAVRADNFGLSTFLLKKKVVGNVRAAKRLSNLIMLTVVFIAAIFLFATNFGGGDNAIDEKYYYDPTQVD